MARVNVYLPDDLAEAVRASELNVSAIAQAALRDALAAQEVTSWLHEVTALPSTGVDHEGVVDAVSGARHELGA